MVATYMVADLDGVERRYTPIAVFEELEFLELLGQVAGDQSRKLDNVGAQVQRYALASTRVGNTLRGFRLPPVLEALAARPRKYAVA
jgi:hypothetical protein